MGMFSTLVVVQNDREAATVPDAGALLAKALLAAPDNWRTRATVDAVIRGSLHDDDLAHARALLAQRHEPALAGLLQPAPDDWVLVIAITPSSTQALAAWPRPIALDYDLEAAVGDVGAARIALALLEAEDRALVFDHGIRMSIHSMDQTASTLVRDLGRLLGVEVTDVEESWDDNCTFERLRSGQSVGGGRLAFRVAGVRHEMYLGFGIWFDFDQVKVMAARLGTVGDDRLYVATANASVVRASAAEARWLQIEWDLPFDPLQSSGS